MVNRGILFLYAYNSDLYFADKQQTILYTAHYIGCQMNDMRASHWKINIQIPLVVT